MADPTPAERIEELQRQVNQRVQEALAGLRQEFGERLRKAGDQIVGELGREIEGVSPELPASFLSADELAPLAAGAEEQTRRDAHGRLTAALSAVDRAGSQAEVLRVLAQEARRFADRSAVLLARDEGLELWSSAGWGDTGGPDKITLPYAADGAWSRGALEAGAAELTGGDAAALAERAGRSAPAAAALVPLVLRDRLAAVVYADVEGSGSPGVEALQALTYTAALALETLPFRERESTSTLAHRGAPPTVPAAAEEEAAAPALEVQPTAPAATDMELPTQAEPAPVFAAGDDEGEPEAAVAEGEEDEAGAEVQVESVEDDGSWTLDEGEDGGGGPQAAVGELEVSEPEELVVEDEAPRFDTDFDDELEVDEDAGLDLEADELAGAPESDEEDLLEVELDDDLEAEIEVDVDEPEAEAPDAEDLEVEEPEVEDAEHEGGAPQGAATAGFEVPGAQPTPSEPPSPPASAPETGAAPAPAAGGSQVAPPTDLEGPGRAFGAAETAPEGDDAARHEEARRLARLLVSEIRLYNEEEVEEGRRNNDIYQRLKEDIDRSRQMYDERVDPAIRDSTDYFYQELVRNLGGGDAATLGI